ncbi:flagellar biosynthesis protein FlhB [Verrucomicrobiota bacterium]|nr:flagellar biosynthesis protein FlhB [Verrucomicrobiota bacterium]
MSEDSGDKTEQPTARRLEEAWGKGQFARSAEIQTVFVVMSGTVALLFAGPQIWRLMSQLVATNLAHLHDLPVTHNAMQGYGINAMLFLGKCAGPVMASCLFGALLAGLLQSRFHAATEALELRWERLNPVAGLQRLFSTSALVNTALAAAKLSLIIALTHNEIRSVFADPIFYTTVDLARIAGFLASSCLRIVFRVGFALVVIAAIDYGYQLWRTHRDMMMTKEEVKDEAKSSDGNPQMKAARKRRRSNNSKRKMLAEVPTADVVVTNPTHLAIALRYDRKKMKAPTIVAKGSRLNALRIREIAKQHQIPIIENKPLARLMFKYGRVGGEIPAQLYGAVAEVLAWAYRVNAYRYYREQNQPTGG